MAGYYQFVSDQENTWLGRASYMCIFFNSPNKFKFTKAVIMYFLYFCFFSTAASFPAKYLCSTHQKWSVHKCPFLSFPHSFTGLWPRASFWCNNKFNLYHDSVLVFWKSSQVCKDGKKWYLAEHDECCPLVICREEKMTEYHHNITILWISTSSIRNRGSDFRTRSRDRH